MPKVSQGQVGPEGKGVVDSEPNLYPDSVQFKDKSVKKPKALQGISEAFEWVVLGLLMIVEFDACSNYLYIML